MRINLQEDEGVEVQMAPLIDCVFLLLIFFLVATTLKEIEPQLPLTMPESTAAVQTQVPEDVLTVQLDIDGNIYLGAEPVSLDILHDQFRAMGDSDPNRPVRIISDRLTPFQSFLHVYELASFEGLTNVRVKAEPPKVQQYR